MPLPPRPPRPIRRAILRALPLAATLAVHLLAVIALTRPQPPRSSRRLAPDDARQALQVRLVHRAVRASAATPPPRRRAMRTARAEPQHTTQTAPASPPPQPAHPAPLNLALPQGWSTPSDDIAGGRGFADAVRAQLPHPARLPGQASIPHAPVFRMVDPRSQGVAGVVRLIGSFTGAVDPRCIQLAKWQGMSLAERSANQVSNAMMEAIERHHHCY